MAQIMDVFLNEGLRDGIDPAEVAAQVVDAVRAGQFWILTHPELRHQPVERMERAERLENPAAMG